MVKYSNEFSNRLIQWYKVHGRFDLPWQKNKTAYRVWISEIMLQQTQVSTVISYYQHFMKSFPNIETLALADENQVLAHWSGLGYYARARNLHKTAKIIHHEHENRFPDTLAALQALPGIGRSTAGAILSFAYQLSTPICDGNVIRVLARYFAIDQPKQTSAASQLFWNLATQLTPKTQTDLYNQAIMDLGATLCTRAKPDCQRCPFEQDCQAHQLARETEFPVNPKRALKPTKQVYMLLCQDQISRKILLEKRPPTGIWGGLWSLPQCDIDIDVSTWCVQTFNLTVQNIKVLDEVLHHFSHFSLKIKPLLLEVNLKKQQVMDSTRLIWYNKTAEFPGGISAPVKKILKGQEYYV